MPRWLIVFLTVILVLVGIGAVTVIMHVAGLAIRSPIVSKTDYRDDRVDRDNDPSTIASPEAAAPPAEPKDPVAEAYEKFAPAGYRLNSLNIPKAGLDSCLKRGGIVMPCPGRRNPQTGNIEGKNFCSADGSAESMCRGG